MPDLDVIRRRMREDWDWRAREDASFYVGFGRRGQSREEFLGSASEVLYALREEFRRFPPQTDFKAMTALEIGCGPGRLMLPLTEVFGRVQGVDISSEMVALARKNLERIEHAEVRQNSGADLDGFPNDSFDYCYSYAVFQHVPEKDIVWNYLREACRVLKPGGILKCQFNGLRTGRSQADTLPSVVGWSERAGVPPQQGTDSGTIPDTWHGVSFQAEELAAFAARMNLQLLAMERCDTQYLWLTARKKAASPEHIPGPVAGARIVRVTDTFTGDAIVAQSGRFSSATVWVVGLDDNADLNNLRVVMDGRPVAPSFIGKHAWNNPTQVNAYLPPGVRSGMLPVELVMDGVTVSNRASMRVFAGGPLAPRVVAATDAVNLLSNLAIESRAVKLRVEEVNLESEDDIRAAISAAIDGWSVRDIEIFCLDPLPRLYQIDLAVPPEVPAGSRELKLRIGAKQFPPLTIQITG